MKYTPQEHSIINLVLSVNPERQPRTFILSELTIAFSIYEKIMKNTENDVFFESEIQLTSEEKVFITKLTKEFRFSVIDGWIVNSLLAKLI